MMDLKISPSVGVARLGSSTVPGGFLLSPDSIGGLPYDVDATTNYKTGFVQNFKDEAGQVKRQGQLFQIFDNDGNEITLDTEGVASITWTVHLANKKAAWYQYSELEGNLLYGDANSYENRGVPFRNPDTQDRQSLIIDPGPRTITGRCMNIEFNKTDVPSGYPAQFPPEHVKFGTPIQSLGTLKTDAQGRVIVLGGYGHAGGLLPLTSYGGSNTWHDDISDGPVYCTVTFDDPNQAPIELKAWVIIGSPDYVPEIVNISNLSDTMFDVGIRYGNIVPEMCLHGVYQDTFRANYQRDILPIIQRIASYRWLANVQSMMTFASNVFDFSDNSEENKENRMNYFSYFRAPNDKSISSPDQPQEQLFKENGNDIFPMMPLNSGSNSVSNVNIVKFLALNETQYFLLSQWAEGKFDTGCGTPYPIDERDMASVGNCVGLPMCPGIEVTWSLQNPRIYDNAAYRIKDHKGNGGYNETGLTPSRDECEGGGCEPGDLTKRMACPWQADFFQCTIQYVNFTDPSINKTTDSDGNTTPLSPTYYAYWWPPQSPWDVLTGEMTAEGQAAGHLPAGVQANYARGINSFVQMVEHWSALAFIRDRNKGQKGFPFFTETERNNELFAFEAVPVGQITGNSKDNDTTIPVFYIPKEQHKQKKRLLSVSSPKAEKMLAFLEQRAFKAIEVHEEHIEQHPRSGTRLRH